MTWCVGRFFFSPAMPFIASKLVQCPTASPSPFYTLISFSIRQLQQRTSRFIMTGSSPFMTGCNNRLVSVHAHTHILVANDARRTNFLPSLPYIGLIPRQQVTPCSMRQYGYALHHYPYFWSHHYTFPTYLPADSQWMVSERCRDDGFLLATICCLLSVYLFWIAIIEATHFSDANLAWCRDAFSHLVRLLRYDQ